MAALSDYLENKLIDWLVRGQSFTPPTTVHVALMTAAPTDASGGTEVAGGGYARASVACSLAAWAGTQAAASTAVSSGTNATTSNNVPVAFPAPTAAWGSVTHIGVYDAATAGNLLWYGALAAPKTINSGDAAPAFPAAALSLQLDN